MLENGYRILRTREFDEWMNREPPRGRTQIYKRLDRIKEYGYFGDCKSVSDYEEGLLKNKVWELRWNDGRRVYYASIPPAKVLLLLGGNKNGQEKDIREAKKIYLQSTISPKEKS